MKSNARSKLHSFRVRAIIVAALGVAVMDRSHAFVVVQNGAAPARKIDVSATAPVALPDRNGVLSVDWVDTKNARLGIGGLTYRVRGALPDIVLANGNHVTDIGNLKKGARVRIQLATDATGASRLSGVNVVAAEPSDASAQVGVAPATTAATTTVTNAPGTNTNTPATGRTGSAKPR